MENDVQPPQEKRKVLPACGNKGCGVSTGICGSLTFGSGNLNDCGYWEKPCKVCEEAFYLDAPELRGRNWD